MLLRLVVTVAFGLVLAAMPALAEEVHHPEHEVWKINPNHLSAVLAGTFVEGESAGTFGVDYEYRSSEFLGLGFVAERAFEPVNATTVLAVADLHIWRGLAVQTGPGVEWIDRDDGEDDETLFVFRLGALYEFEGNGYTVSPQLHLDFTREETSVVVALALGFNF